MKIATETGARVSVPACPGDGTGALSLEKRTAAPTLQPRAPRRVARDLRTRTLHLSLGVFILTAAVTLAKTGRDALYFQHGGLQDLPKAYLGMALLSYRGFEKEGFEIVAAFDAEPKRRRDKKLKQPLLGMDEMPAFIHDHKVKMAILSVPAVAAQEVANQLIQAGVVGILNFSPIVISVPEEVMVNNVNLAIELENLSYFIQE